MRSTWPDRLAARAARRKARLLFVVLTVTGLTVCYGLSRSAPPDMCVFANYPAAAALAGPGTPAGGQDTAGKKDLRPASQATAPAGPAVAQAALGGPGVPAPGDQDGGMLQVCAAVLAVLMLLVLGATRPRGGRFLYELPPPLGPPPARSRRVLAPAAPSLAALQILRV